MVCRESNRTGIKVRHTSSVFPIERTRTIFTKTELYLFEPNFTKLQLLTYIRIVKKKNQNFILRLLIIYQCYDIPSCQCQNVST